MAADDLIDALWNGCAPPAARKSLPVYVHRLRRQLGNHWVGHSGGGYTIHVDPADVDASRFVDLGERGRLMRRDGRLGEAGDLLRQALAQWRAAPYADVAAGPIVADEVMRLNEQRLVTLEERIAIDLDLGRQSELIPELGALVRGHPYRENLQAKLMLALYRDGRQAEALDVFRNVRALLVEELGIEPGTALQRLHQQILTADPAIDGACLDLRGSLRWRSPT